jgi:hypothetical protein
MAIISAIEMLKGLHIAGLCECVLDVLVLDFNMGGVGLDLLGLGLFIQGKCQRGLVSPCICQKEGMHQGWTSRRIDGRRQCRPRLSLWRRRP